MDSFKPKEYMTPARDPDDEDFESDRHLSAFAAQNNPEALATLRLQQEQSIPEHRDLGESQRFNYTLNETPQQQQRSGIMQQTASQAPSIMSTEQTIQK